MPGKQAFLAWPDFAALKNPSSVLLALNRHFWYTLKIYKAHTISGGGESERRLVHFADGAPDVKIAES